MIKRALEGFSISGVKVINTPLKAVVPKDMAHFIYMITDDVWNEKIYSELLKQYADFPIEVITNSGAIEIVLSGESVAYKELYRRLLIRGSAWIFKYLTKENELFILSSYLSLMQELKLQLLMKQFPKIWRSLPAPKANYDQNKRAWSLGEPGDHEFKSIVMTFIPKHIPILYLEGYGDCLSAIRNQPWPKKPKAIFTSNAQLEDDVFKLWCAEKVENGTTLICGQHGGNYGTSLWMFVEEHEIEICDTYLTWGWGENSNSKIKSFGNLKTIGKKTKWNREGYVLLVEMAIPRYSYFMYSVPVASQYLDYFEDQCRFAEGLSSEIRRYMVVRLYRHEYGWDQKKRWQHRYPDVKLDEGVTKIDDLISKSRMCVSTYNATTLLESLSLNVPTIIFWNPSHWELRDEAVPYFHALKEVGIFHDTPEGAAHKVNEIWADVTAWWQSAEIQNVRETFCHRFSRRIDRPIGYLKEIIKQQINTRPY